MPTIDSLNALARLVEETDLGRDLYVRWSRGPAVDLDERGGQRSSQDELTGVALPGLSASPLRVEPWWRDRPIGVWVARRLHDYRHLRQQRGEAVRPWILVGEELGRGPDNEPLVACSRPLAWVSESVLRDCEALVTIQPARQWGPLDRATAADR